MLRKVLGSREFLMKFQTELTIFHAQCGVHARGSSHLSTNQAMYNWQRHKDDREALSICCLCLFGLCLCWWSYFITCLQKKSNLGFVQSAEAFPPPGALLRLRRNHWYQNFCKGIRMIKEEPTESVCSSSGWYISCKNQNQPSPAKILWQRWALCTGWGTDLLAERLHCSGCDKRRYHWNDKLCQSWRPLLTPKWVSCHTGKGARGQEWQCHAMQIRKFLQFVIFCFEREWKQLKICL